MKRICAGMTVLCLTASGLLASRPINDPPYFEEWPEETVVRFREEVKDLAKLKEHLERVTAPNLSGKGAMWWLYDQDMEGFGRKFGVSEEALETALLDIHRVSPRKSVVQWLGFCAGEEGKKVLWDIASDNTQDKYVRICAVKAYLCRADAKEARDVLARLLIGDMREFEPYRTYRSAILVYDEAANDLLKREAVMASLIVALAQEQHRGIFADMDKMLAGRNKEYAQSSQRLAIAQRMSKLPPTNWYGDSPDSLTPTLKSFRFRFFKTNVSTNLTELMARDFGKPSEIKKE